MNETCLLNNGIKLQLIYFDLGITSDNRQLTFYLNKSLDHFIFPVFRHTVVRRARWKFRPSVGSVYKQHFCSIFSINWVYSTQHFSCYGKKQILLVLQSLKYWRTKFTQVLTQFTINFVYCIVVVFVLHIFSEFV